MPDDPPNTSASALPPALTDMGATPNFIGAVKDEWRLFSDRAADYTMGEAIGFGASSIVYQAKWKPTDDPDAKPTPCALKVLDLDSLPPRSLQLLQRETTLMSLSKHPNVLRVRGSWIEGHRLYIALRLMNKGSAADVMRYGWPGGMEEEVIKCILRQALKGLNYLHINGFIHRDIKAANLLIDDDGTVLLGDLGVAADLSEDPHHHISSNRSKVHTTPAAVALAPHQPVIISSTSKAKEIPHSPVRPRIGKRKSFVGTPCWMAPELIQGKQYDASADIYSFGITALELAQGHPPRFRESPQRVLLRTLQEEPPTLDRDGGAYKYTRAFKEMIDSCLLKDPSKRPTAEQLLQSPFLRSAKKKGYLVNAILKDLPPLTNRQERRALAPAQSPNSIDSWDFPTHMVSPTTSILRYAALEEMVAAEDREAAENRDDAVFEFDNELTPSHTQRFERPPFDLDEEPESENGDGDPNDTDDNNDSEISRSLTGTSGTVSTQEVSTAPSSYMAPTSFSLKQANSRPSTSAGHPSYTYESSNAEDTISHRGLSSHSTAPTALSKLGGSNQQPHEKRLTTAVSDPELRNRTIKSSSKKEGGLWKKLKSNLKRPSKDAPDGGDFPRSGSPSMEKSTKLGALFSSSSGGTVRGAA